MPDPEIVIPIPFPFLGVDRGSEPSAGQPKFTTFDLLNVRAVHFGDRKGGGKRDGITKAFSTQLGVAPTLDSDLQDESIWRRVNELNLFIASSQGVVTPCQQVELSSGFGQAGTRMLESPVGSLNVVGEMTTIDGTAVAAANQRFAIWNTDTLAWTAPGGFDTACNNPAALIIFDDGLMYCGGGSTSATKNRLYSRSGTTWTNLSGASGFTGGLAEVHALCSYNGHLYVAGSFTAANGTTCANIVKYTSSGVFVDVASGVSLSGSTTNARIHTLEVYNGKLIAGGKFDKCNGTATTAYCLAAYDGTSWTALDDGTNKGVGATAAGTHEVFALRTWNNRLYIGGSFDRLSNGTIYDGFGFACSWDGAVYSKLIWGLSDRGGQNGSPVGVKAIEIYDDGTGEAVWFFGQFNACSTQDSQGLPAANFASWDGTLWKAAKVGVTNIVRHGLGAGNTSPKKLFMVGSFVRRNCLPAGGIAAFDGANWKAFGGAGATGCNRGSGSLVPSNKTAGNCAVETGSLVQDSEIRLYVSINQSGTTKNASPTNASNSTGDRYGFGSAATYSAGLGVYTGTSASGQWSRLDTASVFFDNSVYALKIWNGKLHIGGAFTTAGTGIPSARIVAWNGSVFQKMGVGPVSDHISAMEIFNDGTNGESLYVADGSGAAFGNTAAGDVTDSGWIARWDGSLWHAVNTGANSGGSNSIIVALRAFNGKLYAGGDFTTVKGTAANRVGSWNGTTWATVGSGTGGGFTSGAVLDLCVYNNVLYASGTFTTTTAGQTVNGIAYFDGTDWQPMGSGLAASAGNMQGTSLFEFGGYLYIGGHFDSANGVTARGLVKWDGSAFTPADSTAVAGFHTTDGTTDQYGDVQVMCQHIDELIAVGQYDFIGGDPSNFVTTSQCS